MALELDAKSAAEAGQTSSVIREAGKYIATITRAQMLVSERGTEGLGLSVVLQDGRTANYLDIYHTKANGEKLSGNKVASAILACLRIRTPVLGQIKFRAWNKEAGRTEDMVAQGYPEMMGKKIGLLLREAWETNERNGKDVRKLEIFAPFCAETERTAGEVLKRAEVPEQLEKMVEWVQQNPVRDARTGSVSRSGQHAAGQAQATRTQEKQAPATSFDDMDDDIPF